MSTEQTGAEAVAAAATSQPVTIEKKRHKHWWQDVPRRLSLTRNRSASVSSTGEGDACAGSPPTPSPTTAEPPPLKKSDRRRSSDATDHHRETTYEIRDRWNRNYNVPPELFVHPWF